MAVSPALTADDWRLVNTNPAVTGCTSLEKREGKGGREGREGREEGRREGGGRKGGKIFL